MKLYSFKSLNVLLENIKIKVQIRLDGEHIRSTQGELNNRSFINRHHENVDSNKIFSPFKKQWVGLTRLLHRN